MESICLQENDKYIGLTIPLDESDVIGETELTQLRPYIINAIGASEKSSLAALLKVVKLSDTKAALTVETNQTNSKLLPALLSTMRDICQTELTEKLIVPQYMGENAPTLKHRVMQFEVTKNNNLVVKYLTLGEANSFSAALAVLAKLYPSKTNRPHDEKKDAK